MRRLIVQRQSPDWSTIGSIEESVAYLEHRLFDPETADGRQKLAYTAELLQFWDRCTGVPFWTMRQRLKDIAQATWRAADADEIVLDADFDATVGDVFAADDLILFVDDDDWIAPDAFARLAALAERTQAGVVWGRVRFDGQWQWLPVHGGPITVYTNNYLVRAGSIAGYRLADAMQHSTLQQAYAAGTWPPVLTELWGVTVTNKSPCSWNYLHQPMQSADPEGEFQRRLRQYAHNDGSVDQRVSWAADSAIRSRQLFQRIAGSSRDNGVGNGG